MIGRPWIFVQTMLLAFVLGGCAYGGSREEAGGESPVPATLTESLPDSTAEEVLPAPESGSEEILSYYIYRKVPCSREEEPGLYEDAERLLNLRLAFWNELDSADTLDWQHSVLVLDGEGGQNVYYLLEGITGWDYFRDKAEQIYSEAYVKDVITPEYTEGSGALFLEQDNQLYRQNADGWMQPMEDSIQIWRDSHHSSQFFYITGRILYEAKDTLYIGHVRVNADKPCGLELIGECDIRIDMGIPQTEEAN